MFINNKWKIMSFRDFHYQFDKKNFSKNLGIMSCRVQLINGHFIFLCVVFV